MKRYLFVLLLAISSSAVWAQDSTTATILMIIDGELASQEVLQQLEQESSVASMQFLPPQKATQRYGTAGARGAMLVSTKKQAVPLVVLDGEKVPADTLDQLSFDRIDVLHGQQALALYGAAGKQGVYLIKSSKASFDAWIKVENRKGKPVEGAVLTDEQGTTLGVSNECGLVWLEQVEAGKKVLVNHKGYTSLNISLDSKKQNIILQK